MKGSFITYSFAGRQYQLYTPDSKNLQEAWNNGGLTDFPYWGKCWPAAIALSEFITKNSSLIQDKLVLELACGLGLPSLVASHCASQVISSDYLSEPLLCVQASAKENKFKNIETRIIDWNRLPIDLSTDVLLLSDINYDPATFEMLNKLMYQFLTNGSTILLSTPQRIMAKPFIEKWLLFQIMHQEYEYDEVKVSVMVLKT